MSPFGIALAKSRALQNIFKVPKVVFLLEPKAFWEEEVDECRTRS